MGACRSTRSSHCHTTNIYGGAVTMCPSTNPSWPWILLNGSMWLCCRKERQDIKDLCGLILFVRIPICPHESDPAGHFSRVQEPKGSPKAGQVAEGLLWPHHPKSRVLPELWGQQLPWGPRRKLQTLLLWAMVFLQASQIPAHNGWHLSCQANSWENPNMNPVLRHPLFCSQIHTPGAGTPWDTAQCRYEISWSLQTLLSTFCPSIYGGFAAAQDKETITLLQRKS